MANNTISQVEINGTTYDLLDANTLSAVSALDQRVTTLESSVGNGYIDIQTREISTDANYNTPFKEAGRPKMVIADFLHDNAGLTPANVPQPGGAYIIQTFESEDNANFIFQIAYRYALLTSGVNEM